MECTWIRWDEEIEEYYDTLTNEPFMYKKQKKEEESYVNNNDNDDMVLTNSRSDSFWTRISKQ